MHRAIVRSIVLLLASALILAGSLAPALAKDEVTVGCKNFTEQYIVGQMMAQLMEARGFEVDLKSDLTSMALRSGLESGDIHICAEYTGTAWMTHLKQEYKPGMDHDDVYRQVEDMDAKNDIVWLSPIWNHNTYALACWPEFAEKHGLKTLSDFAEFVKQQDGKVSTFVDFEFSTRPDGLPALQEHYGFHIAESHLKTGAPGASVLGLKNKQAKVGMVFGTDAAIAENDWVVLQDDKSFFPPYDLSPCLREEVLKKHPKIERILLELVKTFPGGGNAASAEAVAESQAAWQELNAKVDSQKMEPSEVAEAYLIEKGLIEK
jgi:osmoprotectant transport system substrate-binding protein